MKALSIQQPWAYLIANGIKDIENRKWTASYRGFFLIHAGQKLDPSCFDSDDLYTPTIYRMGGGLDIRDKMPLCKQDYRVGGIVGYATLQKVVTRSDSPWYLHGQYGFVLTQRHTVPFIPLRGQLGLFDVPADVEAQINTIREERFHEQESREQTLIAKEWYDYRHVGDETPPTPPSILWG